MKKFNLAALPLAVAGVLASTSAFAGTEACFEVERTAADAVVTDHGTLYTPAACTTTGGTDGSDQLLVPAPAKVAWELTGNLDLDLNDIDAGAGSATPNSHIVYIPTTDIPPASRITMALTNADFGTANANQIYLVSLDSSGEYQTVASSDGAFNDTSSVEFLTKAGVTIGAGTRLVLSNTNPSGVAEDGTLLEAVKIHIANTETCVITPKVAIKATSAKTDSGTTIQGGSSATGGEVDILDISEQFQLVAVAPANPNATRDIEVDAEDPSQRKSFVNNNQDGGSWTNQVLPQAAIWEAKFTNAFDTLDLFVTIDSDDTVDLGLSTDSATGDGVTLEVLVDLTVSADTSLLDASEATHLTTAAQATATLVDITGSTTEQLPITTTAASYEALATQYFQEVATVDAVTNAAVVLRNDATKVMEFNYEVSTSWSMDFNDADKLDKVGCKTPVAFNVGVNGAVLKVPYVYTKANEGGFVRITSEHDTVANVFMDIFDESSNETKNVNVGTLAAKASNVLKADDLLALAIADGYVGTGDRHTMTFTVTAPKNRVHGVSVQKIAGGVDRVMPVLDQNDWSQ
jgi:hypothetical protein